MASLAFLSIRVPLAPGVVYGLGRDRSCEILVPDPHVSRRHAEIQLLPDGTALVTDNASVNGLFVGDERVPFALLLSGQEFLLGVVGFRYE